jgi:hypothetical protein
MNGKQRIPLARARIIAGEVLDLLSPVCERIEIAGSVRREKATVGDIEILCAPRVRHETQMDLFGQATGPTHTYSELDELCTGLLADKRLSYRLNAVGHRAGWGDRNKLARYTHKTVHSRHHWTSSPSIPMPASSGAWHWLSVPARKSSTRH